MMTCGGRNSHTDRKCLQPVARIPVIREVSVERQVEPAYVGMTGETDAAAVCGHEVEMLLKFTAQGVETLFKSGQVGIDIVAEKDSGASILHDMVLGQGAQVGNILTVIERVEIVLLVQPHLVFRKLHTLPVLQRIPVIGKAECRCMVRNPSCGMVVVVARDNDRIPLAQQRQTVMRAPRRLVGVERHAETRDITQADEPVIPFTVNPGKELLQLLDIFVDIRYDRDTQGDRFLFNAESTKNPEPNLPGSKIL
jgi:hypothetical protein